MAPYKVFKKETVNKFVEYNKIIIVYVMVYFFCPHTLFVCGIS